jgi:hypothetical protein
MVAREFLYRVPSSSLHNPENNFRELHCAHLIGHVLWGCQTK